MSQEIMLRSSQEGQSMALAQKDNLPASVNAGSVSIEMRRAVAEAQGQIQVAQMFPRDIARGRAELMDECDSIEFAQVAFYSVPRAGGSVTGPSIRLAEAAASAYGHMIWGHRELSRSEDKSEVEVWAWDMQKNNKRVRQITVDHYRDTSKGRIKLRDEKDVQDKIANVASKQMRGCILAIVSKSFVAAAEARCRATLAGGGGVPLKQRIEKMVDAFAKLGVNVEILEKSLGHSLSITTGDELVDLLATYTAIKGGDKIADHFGAVLNPEEQEQDQDPAAAALAASAKSSADTKAKAKPAAAKAKAEPKVEPKAEVKPEPKQEAKADPVEEKQPDPVDEQQAADPVDDQQDDQQADDAADQQADDQPEEDDDDGKVF